MGARRAGRPRRDRTAETLVLDSTDFWWTNTRTRTRRREFAVLVAYGYTGAGQGRVWGIHASPTARTSDYLDLLRGLQLPGRPASIVTDDDRAIAAAVRRKWPTRTTTADDELPVPFLFACEHHLRLRAAAALEADNAHAGQGRWMRRLDTAFRREEAWEEFRSATAVLGQAAAWVRANDDQIARQVAARHLLPAHYSTAGAEAAAARLRGMFEQRSFALRNATRTNLLLGLARLHLNNRDDVGIYHRLLREAAEQRDGHPHHRAAEQPRPAQRERWTAILPTLTPARQPRRMRRTASVKPWRSLDIQGAPSR